MAISNEERERRRNFLGSSDVAAIFGLDPFRTAGDVWLEKTTGMKPDVATESKEAVRLGNLLEPALLTYVAIEFDLDVKQGGRYEKGILAANLDGEALDKQGDLVVVEAKTTSMPDEWGDEGTDEVPYRVTIQAHVQMLCSNAKRAIVPVLMPKFGRLSLRCYAIERDQMICDHIEHTCSAWWREYVLGKKAPAGTSLPSRAALGRVIRTPNEVPVKLDQKYLDHYWACKDQHIVAKERLENAEVQLLVELGDSEAGVFPDGTLVTYKEIQRKGYTVEPGSYRRLNVGKKPAQKGE